MKNGDNNNKKKIKIQVIIIKLIEKEKNKIMMRKIYFPALERGGVGSGLGVITGGVASSSGLLMPEGTGKTERGQAKPNAICPLTIARAPPRFPPTGGFGLVRQSG